jgi:hypothetical protein
MTRRPMTGKATAQPSAKAGHAATGASRQISAPAGEAVVMTTSTIHMPAELLNALRTAALRRSMRRISGTLGDGKNTRPSVSEIVVEMLQRHRSELDRLE